MREMKRCIVFGANGFLGSNIVGELLAAGHSVLACDLSREFANLGRWMHPRLALLSLDFIDHAAVAEAVVGADWVFHLVSTTVPASSNRNMCFDVETNVCSSIRLLESCVRAGVHRVIFASSGGTVYGHVNHLPIPENTREQPRVSYGIAKLAIEKYCSVFQELHGLRSVCLRVSNPYGPGHQGMVQGIIPVFLKRIRSNEAIEVWGDGTVVRDYVYISDVARAFRLAAQYDGPYSVINIGSGVGLAVKELLTKLEAVVGYPLQVRYGSARSFDVPNVVLDIERARGELGWSPLVSLEDGLRRTWQDIGQHPAPVVEST